MLGEAVVRMCEAITNLPLLSPLPVKEGAGLKEDELPPVIKLIRSKRAGPNTETPDGSTPLICACFLGDQALIEMLVAVILLFSINKCFCKKTIGCELHTLSLFFSRSGTYGIGISGLLFHFPLFRSLFLCWCADVTWLYVYKQIHLEIIIGRGQYIT